MSDRILEVEHKPGEEVVIRIRPVKFPVFPTQARSHFWAAHREGLLALRSLIDVAIELVEEAEKPEEKREKVEVE